MISACLALRNPYKHSPFKNYKTWSGKVSTNKGWEVQFYKYAYNLVELKLDLAWAGSDHAGPTVELNIFGYTAIIKMYDKRHWDYDNHCWEIYEV